MRGIKHGLNYRDALAVVNAGATVYAADGYVYAKFDSDVPTVRPFADCYKAWSLTIQSRAFEALRKRGNIVFVEGVPHCGIWQRPY